MTLKKTLLALAITATASATALADINIGVSLSLTGPGSGLGIHGRNPANRARDDTGFEWVVRQAVRRFSGFVVHDARSVAQLHSALMFSGTGMALMRSGSSGCLMQKARVSKPSHSTVSPRMTTCF